MGEKKQSISITAGLIRVFIPGSVVPFASFPLGLLSLDGILDFCSDQGYNCTSLQRRPNMETVDSPEQLLVGDYDIVVQTDLSSIKRDILLGWDIHGEVQVEAATLRRILEWLLDDKTNLTVTYRD